MLFFCFSVFGERSLSAYLVPCVGYYLRHGMDMALIPRFAAHESAHENVTLGDGAARYCGALALQD